MARNIAYVLSDDFYGFVNVVETSSGIELEPSIDGLVINVPPSGRVEVKSIGLLRKWNLIRARYSSGINLPVFIQGVHEENDFGFWVMGVPAGERLYAFVGNREDLRAFVEKNRKTIYRAPPLDPEEKN